VENNRPRNSPVCNSSLMINHCLGPNARTLGHPRTNDTTHRLALRTAFKRIYFERQ
jgi:hypothetical protein